jgi:hypothetical protein
MVYILLLPAGAEEGAAPIGRVNLRSVVVAPGGGGFTRLLEADGNPAPFAFTCEPPGALNEDEAREVAGALQRGKLAGSLRAYEWRLAPERPGGGEAPTRFLVYRAGQGGHHADRPPCPGARWERIGDSHRWVVELTSLGELVSFQERYGRLTLGRDAGTGLPSLEISADSQ